MTIALEDTDPYRDCYQKPLAGRLAPDAVVRWAAMFQQAWTLLAQYAPDRARELADGLRAVVPLSVADTEPGLSATSRTAFGALALTLPQRAEHLAVTMVHEFQHSKLSALLDTMPLYDAETEERYFAPWRQDPRPVGGLLQGAYAFLAVGEVWGRLSTGAETTTDATRHFAELREQVRHVLDTLVRSPHLNADGYRLIAAMQERLASQLAVRLPTALVVSAREALSEAMAAWRARNDR
jgi:HEXXH motif-containing protein